MRGLIAVAGLAVLVLIGLLIFLGARGLRSSCQRAARAKAQRKEDRARQAWQERKAADRARKEQYEFWEHEAEHAPTEGQRQAAADMLAFMEETDDAHEQHR